MKILEAVYKNEYGYPMENGKISFTDIITGELIDIYSDAEEEKISTNPIELDCNGKGSPIFFSVGHKRPFFMKMINNDGRIVLDGIFVNINKCFKFYKAEWE